MSIRPVAVSVLLLGVLLTGARRADADLTAFLGTNTSPTTRSVRGVAVGLSLLFVGFEFEYSDTQADETGGARRHAGMFNVLAQTPSWFNGLQFYATVGGGLYRDEGAELLDTSAAANSGGGVKVGLLGPFRARFDYRVFMLRGDVALRGESRPDKTYHRFYAGLNLAF